MRDKLARYKLGQRIKAYGTFKRFGKREGWKGEMLITLLLKNIRSRSKQVLTDHLWFNYTKSFQKIKNLQEGDLLRFEATIDTYVKSYEKNQIDFKLSRPTKVVKIKTDLFGDKLDQKEKGVVKI